MDSDDIDDRDDFDEDDLSLREELMEAAGIVLESVDAFALDFESEARERLRSLVAELDAEEDEDFDEARAESLLETVRTSTAQVLRDAAAVAEAPPEGDDPGTAAAIASFERAVAGVVPARDVLRLMDRVDMPGPVLALIAHVREPDSIEEAQAMLSAAIELWNHAPRTEFGGETPAQRAARDEPEADGSGRRTRPRRGGGGGRGPAPGGRRRH